MAGVTSSIAKIDFLNISKAYPQQAFQPKVSTVSFPSASRYLKGRTVASASDGGQQVDELAQKTGENIKIGVEEAQNKVKNMNERIEADADGMVKATQENASNIADKAKEGADQVVSSAQSTQEKTVEAVETAVEAAKDTAQKIKEAVMEKVDN